MSDTKQTDDGGPAHPLDECRGLSIRDWFAGSSTPISLEDARDLMGLPKDMPLDNDRWRMPGEPPIETVRSKWSALSVEEKSAIDARFRFLHADAMVKARKL